MFDKNNNNEPEKSNLAIKKERYMIEIRRENYNNQFKDNRRELNSQSEILQDKGLRFSYA